MRTRVKICGITRPEDARDAVTQGADAIGLMFYRPSPRYISLGRARDIARQTPAFVTTVAVFVNPSREEVEEVIRECDIALLQFHGEEAPEFCASFSRPYVKVARIRPGLDLIKYLSPYAAAKAWMLDAFHDDLWGGTGGAFDWGVVPNNMAKPVILSGGLTADNIPDAIRRLRPHAVDVSTGVEISKGVKDAAKIAAFMKAVKNEDV